jgi:hypothetical protein
MKKEPVEETLEMEYYEKLVQYYDSKWVFFFHQHLSVPLTMCLESASAAHGG